MAKRTTRETSALLINEDPLQVIPSLAVAVGLNEAIILQQVHFWLRRDKHVIEGQSWIYNTYENWQTQFPFWSVDTIKRAIHHLEALGILDSTSRFNRNPVDKSKWYTVNYARLNAFATPSTMQDAPSTMQDAPMDDASCPHSQRDLQRDLQRTPLSYPSPRLQGEVF